MPEKSFAMSFFCYVQWLCKKVTLSKTVNGIFLQCKILEIISMHGVTRNLVYITEVCLPYPMELINKYVILKEVQCG